MVRKLPFLTITMVLIALFVTIAVATTSGSDSNDDEKLFGFFFVTPDRIEQPDGTNKPNVRTISLILDHPTVTIKEKLSISLFKSNEPDNKAPIFANGTQGNCQTFTGTAFVPISHNLADNNSTLELDFSKVPIQVDSSNTMVQCNEVVVLDYNLDESKWLDTQISAQVSYKGTKYESATIYGLNDNVQVAESMDLILTPNGTANQRNFAIRFNNTKIGINSSYTLSFQKPHDRLLAVAKDATPKCEHDGKEVEVDWNDYMSKVTLSFWNAPIEMGKDAVINCTGIYLDFASSTGVQTRAILSEGLSARTIVAVVEPVDDSDPTPTPTPDQTWKFELVTSGRSQYQFVAPLTIDEFPTIFDAGFEFKLNLAPTGMVCDATKKVNIQTMVMTRSYDTLTTTYNLPIGADCKLVDVEFSFQRSPEIDQREAMHLMAIIFPTIETQPNVDFSSLDLFSIKTQSHYTQSKDVTTTFPYDQPVAKDVKSVYGKFVDIYKSGLLKAPLFEVVVIGTTQPLGYVTVMTDTFDISNPMEPSFLFRRKDVTECLLVEYNIGVPLLGVEEGEPQQGLKFDFSGIKVVQDPGQSFTISCGDVVVLPKSADNTALTFMMVAAKVDDEDEQETWTNSWKMPKWN